MDRASIAALCLAGVALGVFAAAPRAQEGAGMGAAGKRAAAVEPPAPAPSAKLSLEEALAHRRSIREFARTPLSERELGQLLWAAQGVTGSDGRRTAPSAGALYPLELYVATASGFFHYDPQHHRLEGLWDRDLRPALAQAALDQESVGEAPAVFVITAVYSRTAQKYGPARSPRYVHMEAGHAAQNLLLEAGALGLGAVPVGAFQDGQVQRVLVLPVDEQPLYLLPVGHPR